MATEKLNNYSALDNNITEMQLTEDASFVGKHNVSLTGWATTAAPTIAAGSKVEINGSLYQVTSDESISGSPSDGVVYIIVDGGVSAFTAAYTNTDPTWSDSKQGYYGTGADANKRYLDFVLFKSGTSYNKYQYPERMKEKILLDIILATSTFSTTVSATTGNITTANITTANITTAAITNNASYYLDDDGVGTSLSIATSGGTGTYLLKVKKSCTLIFYAASATSGGGTIAGSYKPFWYNGATKLYFNNTDASPSNTFSFANDTLRYIHHVSPCYVEITLTTMGPSTTFRAYVMGWDGATSTSAIGDILELI